MKKLLWIILPLAAFITAGCLYTILLTTPLFGEVLKDSGPLATKSIPVPEFNAIQASRGVRVILSEQASKIHIEANERLLKHVIAEVSDSELRISIDPAIKNARDMEAVVTVPISNREIRQLSASSAAHIEGDLPLPSREIRLEASSAASVKTAIQADECHVKASSAARIELAAVAPTCRIEASSAAKILASIQSESCRADASSASRIELSGSSKNFEAKTNSAAKIRVGALDTQCATADASSSSSIEIAATEHLAAAASSGSSVRYKGNCRLEASESSGGRIRKI